MKTLELFAGSRSFSKVAENYGFKTYTTDNQDFNNIDQVCDIFDFDIDKMLEEFGKPDIIWASPPCTYFSVASIGHHWNKDHTPKTVEAELGVKIIKKTKSIIKRLAPLYYFVENPRGLLRKQEMMNWFAYRKTVTYCSYGDMRMKPTDVWTNFDWKPKPMCHNGNRDCHHEPAPRGSQTGTQGLKGSYERSKIPPELFTELFEQINGGKNEI